MDITKEIELNTKEFQELQQKQEILTQQLNDVYQRMIKCVGKDELLRKLSNENGQSKEVIPVKAEGMSDQDSAEQEIQEAEK